MAIDKEYVEEALLRWNYFPNQKSKGDELPPIFTTRNLVPKVAENLRKLPLRKKEGYDQVEYLSTRYNNVSRPLSIPHPVGYASLVECIRDNWNEFDYICKNENSRVKPDTHGDGRLIIMDYGDDYSTAQRALAFGFGKKYRVHVDIANCYPSIYTHAIPWALVGIKYSKANKGPSLWFNNLDFHQRLIKRNETQGVAIGPATSNIFCEAILARIDETLSKDFSYFRYIDDYTCYCDTAEQGQEFIRRLRDELKQYKLTINIKKTEVVELPAPIDPDWIVDLSTRMPSGTPNPPPKSGKYYTASEATRYIDYAVKLNQTTPDGSVLKFAVKSIMYRLDEAAKLQVLDYLLNLSRFYPLLLPCLDYLLDSDEAEPKDYESHLNTIVRENAVERRSDGMAWGLYYLNKHKLEIDEEIAKQVIASRDCIAILCLYLSGKFTAEVKGFVSTLDDTDLYELDQYWLLLYQLFFDKKIPSPYKSEKAFELLKKEDVSFVDRQGNFTKAEIDCLFEEFDLQPHSETSDLVYAVVVSFSASGKRMYAFVSKDETYPLIISNFNWPKPPSIGDCLNLQIENGAVISATPTPAIKSQHVSSGTGVIKVSAQGFGFVDDAYVHESLLDSTWDGKQVSYIKILDKHPDPSVIDPTWRVIKVALDIEQ